MKIHLTIKSMALFAIAMAASLVHAQQTDTWNGGGTSGFWADAGNWGGTAPNATGDNLIFSGSTRPVTTNNLVTTVGWVRLNPTAAFTLSGTIVTNNVAITNSALANVWNAPLALGGNVNIDVASGTTLTISNVLSGALGTSLTQTSAGTLALNNAANTFTGAVYVATGTLQLGNVTTTATYTYPGSGLIAFNNATLYFNGSSGGTVTHTYNFPYLTAPIGVTNSTLKFVSSNATTKQLNAAFNFNGTNIVTYTSSAFTHNLNFNYPITGSGMLTFNWSGTTSGRGININSNANNYSGTIVLNATPTAGNFNVKSSIGPAALVVSNLWTVVNAVTNGLDSINSISILSAAAGGLNLSQYGWSNSSALLTVNSGLVTMGNTTTGTTNFIGSLVGNGGMITNVGTFPSYLTINQTSNATYAGIISELPGAPLSVTKNGPATLTLSGTNGYSGLTTINAGGLQVNGVLASTNVIVNTNTALSGSGILLGSVAVNAGGSVVASGLSPLTLSALSLGVNPADNLTLTVTGNGTSIAGFVAVTNSGTFTNNGTVKVNVVGALPPGVSVYNVLTYTGASAGSGTYTAGALASGVIGYITNNTSASAIQLVVTGSDYLKWVGSPTNDWDLLGHNDWVFASTLTPGSYQDTERVTFDDTAVNFSVNIASSVAPGGIEVSNNANTYQFAGSGKITGATTLTKDGSATLVVTTTNDYTGQTIINNGTVQLGDGVSNNGNLASSISNNTSLVFANPGSQTYAGIVSGPGAVLKQSAGALTVSGNNSYTGLTTINTGTLVAGSGAALGSTNSGTVVASGSLDVNGQNLGGEAISISGQGVGNNGAVVNNGPAQTSAVQSLTLNNNSSIGGTNRWDVRDAGNGAVLNLSGMTLTKTGSNDIALVGTTVSDGNIVVNQGRFGLQLGTVFPQGAGQITVNPAGTLWVGDFGTPLQVNQPITLNGGVVQADSGTTATLGSAITLTANSTFSATVPIYLTNIVSGTGLVTKTGNSTLILDAPTNTWNGGLFISAGTVQVGNNDGNGALPSTITVVTNNGLLSFALVNDFAFNQAMVGTGGVMQAGVDTITMTNQQSYSGPTVIQNGTLLLAGGNNTLSNATVLEFTGTSTLNMGTNSQQVSGLTINNNMTGTVLGTGFLSVTGANNLLLGSTGGTTPTLDMSGLNTFTYNQSNNIFSVSGEATAANSSGAANLALTNLITASRFGVSDNGGYPGYTSSGTVNLGAVNVINANTIDIGVGSTPTAAGGWVSTGTVGFESAPLNPSLVIRDATGTGRANMLIGYAAASDYSGGTGTIDLIAGVNGNSTLDALLGSLIIGQETYANVNFSRTGTGFFNMGNGTLDATNIVLGQKPYSGGKATSSAIGKFALTGGTVKVNTMLIGDQVATNGPSVSGEFDLNTGTLMAGTINAGAGNAQRTFNWNDGVIQNYNSGTDLNINGITLTLNGGLGTPTFNLGTGRTGTINNGGLSGGGPLVKNGLGTLVINGDNTGYSGTLTNQAGAVFINAPTPSGSAEVYSGATLGGSNTLNSIQVDAGGILQAGDITGTGVLGATTLNLGGVGSTTDKTYSTFKLASGGQVTAGTLTVNGTNTVTVTGPLTATGTYNLFNYTGSIGGSGINGFKLAPLPSPATGYLQDNPGVAVQLVVTSVVNTSPTNITASVTGSTLTLSWPADHLGWRLLTQTNSLSTGIGTNWYTWPNSTNVTSVPVTINPANPTVFFRLVYP